MKIRIYWGRDEQWHVQFRAKNNRIIFDAGGYNKWQSAKKAVDKSITCIRQNQYRIVVEERK